MQYRTDEEVSEYLQDNFDANVSSIINFGDYLSLWDHLIGKTKHDINAKTVFDLWNLKQKGGISESSKKYLGRKLLYCVYDLLDKGFTKELIKGVRQILIKDLEVDQDSFTIKKENDISVIAQLGKQICGSLENAKYLMDSNIGRWLYSGRGVVCSMKEAKVMASDSPVLYTFLVFVYLLKRDLKILDSEGISIDEELELFASKLVYPRKAKDIPFFIADWDGKKLGRASVINTKFNCAITDVEACAREVFDDMGEFNLYMYHGEEFIPFSKLLLVNNQVSYLEQEFPSRLYAVSNSALKDEVLKNEVLKNIPKNYPEDRNELKAAVQVDETLEKKKEILKHPNVQHYSAPVTSAQGQDDDAGEMREARKVIKDCWNDHEKKDLEEAMATSIEQSVTNIDIEDYYTWVHEFCKRRKQLKENRENEFQYWRKEIEQNPVIEADDREPATAEKIPLKNLIANYIKEHKLQGEASEAERLITTIEKSIAAWLTMTAQKRNKYDAHLRSMMGSDDPFYVLFDLVESLEIRGGTRALPKKAKVIAGSRLVVSKKSMHNDNGDGDDGGKADTNIVMENVVSTSLTTHPNADSAEISVSFSLCGLSTSHIYVVLDLNVLFLNSSYRSNNGKETQSGAPVQYFCPTEFEKEQFVVAAFPDENAVSEFAAIDKPSFDNARKVGPVSAWELLCELQRSKIVDFLIVDVKTTKSSLSLRLDVQRMQVKPSCSYERVIIPCVPHEVLFTLSRSASEEGDSGDSIAADLEQIKRTYLALCVVAVPITGAAVQKNIVVETLQKVANTAEQAPLGVSVQSLIQSLKLLFNHGQLQQQQQHLSASASSLPTALPNSVLYGIGPAAWNLFLGNSNENIQSDSDSNSDASSDGGAIVDASSEDLKASIAHLRDKFREHWAQVLHMTTPANTQDDSGDAVASGGTNGNVASSPILLETKSILLDMILPRPGVTVDRPVLVTESHVRYLRHYFVNKTHHHIITRVVDQFNLDAVKYWLGTLARPVYVGDVATSQDQWSGLRVLVLRIVGRLAPVDLDHLITSAVLIPNLRTCVMHADWIVSAFNLMNKPSFLNIPRSISCTAKTAKSIQFKVDSSGTTASVGRLVLLTSSFFAASPGRFLGCFKGGADVIDELCNRRQLWKYDLGHLIFGHGKHDDSDAENEGDHRHGVFIEDNTDIDGKGATSLCCVIYSNDIQYTANVLKKLLKRKSIAETNNVNQQYFGADQGTTNTTTASPNIDDITMIDCQQRAQQNIVDQVDAAIKASGRNMMEDSELPSPIVLFHSHLTSWNSRRLIVQKCYDKKFPLIFVDACEDPRYRAIPIQCSENKNEETIVHPIFFQSSYDHAELATLVRNEQGNDNDVSTILHRFRCLQLLFGNCIDSVALRVLAKRTTSDQWAERHDFKEAAHLARQMGLKPPTDLEWVGIMWHAVEQSYADVETTVTVVALIALHMFETEREKERERYAATNPPSGNLSRVASFKDDGRPRSGSKLIDPSVILGAHFDANISAASSSAVDRSHLLKFVRLVDKYVQMMHKSGFSFSFDVLLEAEPLLQFSSQAVRIGTYELHLRRLAGEFAAGALEWNRISSSQCWILQSCEYFKLDNTRTRCPLSVFTRRSNPVRNSWSSCLYQLQEEDGTASFEEIQTKVAQRQELDWNKLPTQWNAFPYGAVALRQFLECADNGLLLMICISSQMLCSILGTVQSGEGNQVWLSHSASQKLAHQITALDRMIKEVSNLQQVEQGDEGTSSAGAESMVIPDWLKERLSLIKWLLCNAKILTPKECNLSMTDVSVVLRSEYGITFKMTEIGSVILVLQSDELSQQENIIQAIQKMKNPLIPDPDLSTNGGTLPEKLVLGCAWLKLVVMDVSMDPKSQDPGTLASSKFVVLLKDIAGCEASEDLSSESEEIYAPRRRAPPQDLVSSYCLTTRALREFSGVCQCYTQIKHLLRLVWSTMDMSSASNVITVGSTIMRGVLANRGLRLASAVPLMIAKKIVSSSDFRVADVAAYSTDGDDINSSRKDLKIQSIFSNLLKWMLNYFSGAGNGDSEDIIRSVIEGSNKLLKGQGLAFDISDDEMEGRGAPMSRAYITMLSQCELFASGKPYDNTVIAWWQILTNDKDSVRAFLNILKDGEQFRNLKRAAIVVWLLHPSEYAVPPAWSLTHEYMSMAKKLLQDDKTQVFTRAWDKAFDHTPAAQMPAAVALQAPCCTPAHIANEIKSILGNLDSQRGDIRPYTCVMWRSMDLTVFQRYLPSEVLNKWKPSICEWLKASEQADEEWMASMNKSEAIIAVPMMVQDGMTPITLFVNLCSLRRCLALMVPYFQDVEKKSALSNPSNRKSVMFALRLLLVWCHAAGKALPQLLGELELGIPSILQNDDNSYLAYGEVAKQMIEEFEQKELSLDESARVFKSSKSGCTEIDIAVGDLKKEDDGWKMYDQKTQDKIEKMQVSNVRPFVVDPYIVCTQSGCLFGANALDFEYTASSLLNFLPLVALNKPREELMKLLTEHESNEALVLSSKVFWQYATEKAESDEDWSPWTVCNSYLRVARKSCATLRDEIGIAEYFLVHVMCHWFAPDECTNLQLLMTRPPQNDNEEDSLFAIAGKFIADFMENASPRVLAVFNCCISVIALQHELLGIFEFVQIPDQEPPSGEVTEYSTRYYLSDPVLNKLVSDDEGKWAARLAKNEVGNVSKSSDVDNEYGVVQQQLQANRKFNAGNGNDRCSLFQSVKTFGSGSGVDSIHGVMTGLSDPNMRIGSQIQDSRLQNVLEKGELLIDARELFETRWYEVEDNHKKTDWFAEISIRNGLECFLVLNRVEFVDRSQLDTKPDDAWFPFEYVTFCTEIDDKDPSKEIVGSFTNFGEAFSYINEHAGPSVTIQTDSVLLARGKSKAWRCAVIDTMVQDETKDLIWLMLARFQRVQIHIAEKPDEIDENQNNNDDDNESGDEAGNDKEKCDTMYLPIPKPISSLLEKMISICDAVRHSSQPPVALEVVLQEAMQKCLKEISKPGHRFEALVKTMLTELNEKKVTVTEIHVRQILNELLPCLRHQNFLNFCFQVKKEKWSEYFKFMIAPDRSDASKLLLKCSELSEQESTEHRSGIVNANRLRPIPVEFEFLYVNKEQQVGGGSGNQVALLFESSYLYPSSAEGNGFMDLREKRVELRRWIVDVLRSPMLVIAKHNFLYCTRLNTTEAQRDVLLSDTIVVYSMIQCCPVESIQSQLGNKFDFAKGKSNELPIAGLLKRKDFRYGVIICSGIIDEITKSTYGWMNNCVRYCKVESRNIRDEQLYLEIVNFFDDNHHIVYVEGLKIASDLFLKWCCEHTKRYPWRYIYFSGLDVNYTFSEIRDRMEFYKADATFVLKHGILSLNQAWNRLYPVVEIPDNYNWEDEDNDDSGGSDEIDAAEVGNHWDDEARHLILNNERCLLLLVSPPGAGKTHLMEKKVTPKLQKKGVEVQLLDCSEDSLVRMSITEKLDRMFSDPTKLCCLIADEFHLLNQKQKRELFNWMSDKLTWLRVVLIGNRLLKIDLELMDWIRLVSQTGKKNQKSTVVIQPMKVVLTPEKIVSICDKQERLGDFQSQFFNSWYSTLQQLLGPECLSLRDAFSLRKINIGNSNIGNVRMDNLQEFLVKRLVTKNPMLGECFAAEFVAGLMQVFGFGDGQLDATMDIEKGIEKWFEESFEKESNPITLLAAAAAAPHVLAKGTRLEPFSKFSARPSACLLHPAVRLAKWTGKLLHACRKERSLKNLVEIFGAAAYIDQDPIPLIFPTPIKVVEAEKRVHDLRAASLDITSGLAMGIEGDYRNLDWLRSLLVHRQPVDWSKAKATWAKYFIDDVYEFDALLQDCPNKAACIDSVDAENMSNIAERLGTHRLHQVMQALFEFSDIEKKLPLDAAHQQPDLSRWIKFTANTEKKDHLVLYTMWRLLFNSWANEEYRKAISDPKTQQKFDQMVEVAGKLSDSEFDDPVLEDQHNAYMSWPLALLVWGSEKGRVYSQVAYEKDIEEQFEEKLRKMLVRCTNALISGYTHQPESSELALKLWLRPAYAFLLKSALPRVDAADHPQRLTPSSLFRIVSLAKEASPQWPEYAQHLHAIFHPSSSQSKLCLSPPKLTPQQQKETGVSSSSAPWNPAMLRAAFASHPDLFTSFMMGLSEALKIEPDAILEEYGRNVLNLHDIICNLDSSIDLTVLVRSISNADVTPKMIANIRANWECESLAKALETRR